MASEDELHRRLDNINRRLDRMDLRGVRANAGQVRNAASWASLPAAYPRNTDNFAFNNAVWTTYIRVVGCNNRGVGGFTFQIWDVTGVVFSTGPAVLWWSGVTNSDGYGSFPSSPPSPSNHTYRIAGHGSDGGVYEGLIDYPFFSVPFGFTITANNMTFEVAAPTASGWGCVVNLDDPVWSGNLSYADPYNSGHASSLPFTYSGTVWNGTALVAGTSKYRYGFSFGGVDGPGLTLLGLHNATSSSPGFGYLQAGNTSTFLFMVGAVADTWSGSPFHGSYTLVDPPQFVGAPPGVVDPVISNGFASGSGMVVTVDENP